MRTVALLIVLVAAFFLLMTDKKLTFSKGNKSSSSSPSSSNESTFDPLSDEFKPQDLSKYSNIQKLNEDFDYRRSKLEYQLDEEVKEFIKNHDRYGKDKEAYDKIVKHHAELRKEFYNNRMKTLKSYQDGTGDGVPEEPINRDLR